LSAQNFYVAIVKGKVFYDDKPLKPRDKIEMKGSFRFSTPDDYVKVSGPTGFHTIRPIKKANGGFEFLRAVQAELFPEAKPLKSFVLSTHEFLGDVLDIYDENEWDPESFVSGERINLKNEIKKRDQKKLRWVYQTRSGALHQATPKLVGREMELQAADFRHHPPQDSILNGEAYLFIVRDMDAFNRMANQQPLNEFFETTSPEWNKIDFNSAAVVSLGTISAYKVLPREDVMSNLLFTLIASGQDDAFCFMLPSYCALDAEGYSDILRDQYGVMNYSRVLQSFVDYLGKRRKEDSRYLELWKLNKKR
jgi:hypothetical protein